MAEHNGQRLVAGLWCGEVLERLPDWVDGALSPEARAQLEAHVGACDWCERFGGRYGALVATLRQAPKAPESLAERLGEGFMGDLPDQD